MDMKKTLKAMVALCMKGAKAYVKIKYGVDVDRILREQNDVWRNDCTVANCKCGEKPKV